MSSAKSLKITIGKIVKILLALVVVAVVGYFGWQNFSQLSKKATSDNDSSNQTVDTTLTNTLTDEQYNTGLTVKYPIDWKVTDADLFSWQLKHYTVEGAPKNYVSKVGSKTITSPDGKISVIVDFVEGDIPSTCDTSDNNMKIGQINTDSISATKDYVFGVIIDQNINGDNSIYNIGAFKSGDWTSKSKKGDQYCNVGSRSILAKAGDPNINVTIDIKFNEVTDGGPSTLKDVTDAMSTEDYLKAKHIVQSLSL